MIWFVWESQSWKSASCSLLRRTKHPIALNDHPHGIILNHHTGHFFSTFIKQTWKSRPNEIWIYRRFITMSQWLLSFIVDDEKPMKCKHCTLASNLLSIQWLASWEGVEIDSRFGFIADLSRCRNDCCLLSWTMKNPWNVNTVL